MGLDAISSQAGWNPPIFQDTTGEKSNADSYPSLALLNVVVFWGGDQRS